MSNLPKIPQISPFGETYYKQEVSVVLLFGLTELQAQLLWIENVSISHSLFQHSIQCDYQGL